MKKGSLISVLFVFLCAAIMSCSSGAYTATPNNNLANKPNPIYYKLAMNAKINKVQWNASPDPVAHIIQVGSTRAINIFGTYGIDSTTNYQAIQLTIYNYHGAGTYKLNNDGIANYIYDSTKAVPSLTGQITVSSDNGLYVNGTFSFVSPKDTVTNGNFYAILD